MSYIVSLRMLPLWATVTARQSIVVTCPGSTNLGLQRYSKPTKSNGAKGIRDDQSFDPPQNRGNQMSHEPRKKNPSDTFH